MKKLKQTKGIIISFIIGVILASSIAVYAYSYYAKDIGYTKPGTNTEISVEAALNELYSSEEFKTYNMLDKTIITGDGYNLKKLTLKNNEKDKIMYLKLEADVVVQDRNDTYSIDLTEFNINQILDYKVYNYTSSGNFRISSSNFTKDSIDIKCDSNWGQDNKYNYNYLIILIYK